MCKFDLKMMESKDEIRGKAYVHYQSWHETYPGLVDAKYLKQLTLARCTEIAHRWLDHIMIARDAGSVIGFVGCGAYRDHMLPDCGEIYALYVVPRIREKKLDTHS